MSSIEPVHTLRERIEKAKQNRILAGSEVTLLGASKSQPARVILEAAQAGVRDFGENRVQEAEEKWPAIREQYPDLRLHLIGPLQTNKVKAAVKLFDVIQTVDRLKLAEALAEEMAKTGKTLPCFIQVNTGKEAQKAGVLPEEADALIEQCRRMKLPIIGLMCVPPVDKPATPHFAMLYQMAQSHGLKELSMGMSDDFESAIRMGSTCVRLGRVLFGERS